MRDNKKENITMTIHITNYQDPETGAMYKSIAWKDKFKDKEHGDFMLSESLYWEWNTEEACKCIEALTEQRDLIFEKLEQEV